MNIVDIGNGLFAISKRSYWTREILYYDPSDRGWYNGIYTGSRFSSLEAARKTACILKNGYPIVEKVDCEQD